MLTIVKIPHTKKVCYILSILLVLSYFTIFQAIGDVERMSQRLNELLLTLLINRDIHQYLLFFGFFNPSQSSALSVKEHQKIIMSSQEIRKPNPIKRNRGLHGCRPIHNTSITWQHKVKYVVSKGMPKEAACLRA